MKLTKQGPNTITSKKALLSELDEIQSEGFAVKQRGARARTALDRRARAQRGA